MLECNFGYTEDVQKRLNDRFTHGVISTEDDVEYDFYVAEGTYEDGEEIVSDFDNVEIHEDCGSLLRLKLVEGDENIAEEISESNVFLGEYVYTGGKYSDHDFAIVWEHGSVSTGTLENIEEKGVTLEYVSTANNILRLYEGPSLGANEMAFYFSLND